jgi:protein involved in polysaccharide export with SLBB domain
MWMERVLRVIAMAAVLLVGMGPRVHAQEERPAGEEARIRAGDQIVLKIWREPEMSGTFTVDEDGEVVLPRLGAVRVVDQTAGALQDSLRLELARYLRSPSVEVTVLRRVGIHGEVRRPDLYMVDLTMTLRDVIAKAGGVMETGDPEDIVIVRDGERIRLDEQGRARFVTAELRSGDQIVVGRRSWFALNPLAVVSTGTAVVSVLITVVLPLLR